MDVLSDVLSALKVKGCIYFTTRFHAPWGINIPQLKNTARFHLVTNGHCAVRINQSEEVTNLGSGDIIVVPYGKPHQLSDMAGSPIAKLDDAFESGGFNGEGVFEYHPHGKGDETNLICGHLEFDEDFLHPLITQLPDCIVVRAKELVDFDWLAQAILSLTQSQQSLQMGNTAIVRKLSEIIFIHVIRVWQETLKTKDNFLYAISDPHIGRSLQRFHEQPQKKWTLPTLASEAGLSRTSFVERFRTLVGMTPMQYITLWRVQQAQLLLAESGQSVDQVAENVGYDSISAFARVFKKLVGFAPGAYRKRSSGKSNDKS